MSDEQTPEELTVRAIERDPWNAVVLPIPEGADTPLLRQIEKTVGRLISPYKSWDDVPEGEGADYAYARDRLDDVRALLDRHALDIEFLARPPEQTAFKNELLTIEAIERDKWNAVDLPLPENASKELLQRAYIAADACCVEAHTACDYDLAGGPAVEAARQFRRFADYEFIDMHKDDHNAAINRLELLRERGASPPDQTPPDRGGPTGKRDAAMCHSDDLATGGQDWQRAAGDATLTPESQRQRDLAEYLVALTHTAGVKGTEEHKAFETQQAALGEQITRESDPDKRAELRAEREAQGNEYAAGLSMGLVVLLEASGQHEDAKDLRLAAETRAAIAAELRGSGQTPPAHDDPSQTTEEFAKDAAAVGQAIGLGPTARTVFVAEFPGNNPNDINGRARGKDYHALRAANSTIPEMTDLEPTDAMRDAARSRATNGFDRAVFMAASPAGTILQEGPKHDLATTEQPETSTQSVAAIENDGAGVNAEDALLARQADETTKRQDAERKALGGQTVSDQGNSGGSDWRSKIDNAVKANREVREAALTSDNEKDNGLIEQSAAPAFRSFGGR